MRKLLLISMVMLSIWSSQAQTAKDFRSNTKDTLYGKLVSDPYRAMEDTSNAQLKAWMHQEADQTTAFFNSMPGRDKLYQEMMDAYKNAKGIGVGDVYYWRGKYYTLKLQPGDQYDRFYEVDKTGKSKELFDPHKEHTEIKSKNIRMSIGQFSPNSPWMFYYLIVGGYEFEPKGVFRNMETGKEIYDTLYTAMPSLFSSFDPDNSNAFYYEHFPLFKKQGIDPNRWFDSMRIARHVIGTPPSADKVIIGINDSIIKRNYDDLISIWVDKDVPFAFAMVKNMVANEYRIYSAPRKELAAETIPWKQITDWDDKISQYAMKDNWLYLLTSKNASNGKVLRIDLRNPSLASAVEILPASRKRLSKIQVTKEGLLVAAVDGSAGKLYRITHGSSKLDSLLLPIPGNINIKWADRNEKDFVVEVNSYVRPVELYEYDGATNKFSPSKIQDYHATDLAPLVVEEIEVKSHDSVLVPMTVVYKKGLKLDGSHPISIAAYGAYGIQDDPYYYAENMIWFNRGGIRAYAHVRGGGVYGEDWHLAGQKATKPNTWKDLIACSQWLVDHKYATTKNLVATGGSAGGITMGRAVTERPDLFGGMMIYVGLLDMVRFEKSPNGEGNVPEFGSTKTEDGFKALYAMSTYHNIKDGTAFPPILFSAGFNDNRVPVWMTLKTTARMREVNTSSNPILLRLSFDAGHGAQGTMGEVLKQGADNWSFYFWRAGLPEFQPTVDKKGF